MNFEWFMNTAAELLELRLKEGDEGKQDIADSLDADLRAVWVGYRMNFDAYIDMAREAMQMRMEADELREAWEDYGASPGCGCGCGGDTFDWDGQAEAFAEADELDEIAFDIEEALRRIWEEKNGKRGGKKD